MENETDELKKNDVEEALNACLSLYWFFYYNRKHLNADPLLLSNITALGRHLRLLKYTLSFKPSRIPK